MCVLQSESAEEKERELSQELSRIQHEVGEFKEVYVTTKIKAGLRYLNPSSLFLILASL